MSELDGIFAGLHGAPRASRSGSNETGKAHTEKKESPKSEEHSADGMRARKDLGKNEGAPDALRDDSRKATRTKRSHEGDTDKPKKAKRTEDTPAKNAPDKSRASDSAAQRPVPVVVHDASATNKPKTQQGPPPRDEDFDSRGTRSYLLTEGNARRKATGFSPRTSSSSMAAVASTIC